MKDFYTLIVLFFVNQAGFSQFGEQVVISTEIESPRFLKATDINEDGMIDLMYVGEGNKLYWLEGLNNQGEFNTAQILYDTGNSYYEIKLMDIDNDDLEDIVFFHGNNTISYLKKLSNDGAYASQVLLVSTGSMVINNFQIFDIDEDNDLDIVAFGFDSNGVSSTIKSYENLNNNLQFGNETTLYVGSDFGEDKMYLKDIDGDGLLDILGYDNFSNNGGLEIFYLKNMQGDGFEAPINIYQFDFLLSQQTTILSFDLVDVNTDGLADIMFTTEREYGEQIEYNRYWLENLDGQGNYSEPINSVFLSSFYILGDVDNDEDIDIVYSSNQGDEIDWAENSDGLGQFLGKPTITTLVDNLRSIVLADINNDNYLDVISASVGDNKIAWYPNTTLNVNEFQTSQFQLFPNPSKNYINIRTKEPSFNIEVRDALGRVIATYINTPKISLESQSNGLYSITITTPSGSQKTFKLLKQ